MQSGRKQKLLHSQKMVLGDQSLKTKSAFEIDSFIFTPSRIYNQGIVDIIFFFNSSVLLVASNLYFRFITFTVKELTLTSSLKASTFLLYFLSLPVLAKKNNIKKYFIVSLSSYVLRLRLLKIIDTHHAHKSGAWTLRCRCSKVSHL